MHSVPPSPHRSKTCYCCNRAVAPDEMMYRVYGGTSCQQCADKKSKRDAARKLRQDDPVCPDCGTRHPDPPCGAAASAPAAGDKRRRNAGHGYSGGDGMTDL